VAIPPAGQPQSVERAIPPARIGAALTLRMHDDRGRALPLQCRWHRLPADPGVVVRRHRPRSGPMNPDRTSRAAARTAATTTTTTATATTASDDRATLGGLRYCGDDRPGIRRRRAGRGFSYRDPDGRTIRDPDAIARIRSIVIPPAWTDVWICPWPNGHLQATGRDARGRKVYRYHQRYRRRRDGAKFERLIAFATALPNIREQVDRDLGRRGLPREKVVAAVVRLLELTLIRVGNDEYARLNRSFGLTTLRDRHANVDGSAITFRFRGKSGQQHEVGLRDRRLAGVVRRCRDLPGQELFQYVGEDDEPHDIASDDVNAYLAAVAPGITAKDFRTWAGTVLAYRALRAIGRGATDREKQRNLAAAIQATAANLGNTPAIARQAYVHPAVVDAYLDGRIRAALVEAAEDTDEPPGATDPDEEKAVVALLRARLREDAARSRGPARRARSTRAPARAHG
jgi:DNA topoisomerase I